MSIRNVLYKLHIKISILLIAFTGFSMSSGAQKTIRLYQEIPNSKTVINYKEKADTGTDGVIRISKVSIPDIAVFQPKSSSPKNPAVIICPGGGYSILAYNLEGTTIAKILNSWGATAFVLKYRLPDSSIMNDPSIGPLQDAQRALQLVRENAAQWRVDPEKVGIMGFSAGGHLAATASTHFEKVFISNPNQVSLRPDFSILVYPVISLKADITHRGSRDNLLGKNASEKMINDFSNELQVTKNTPPAFLILAGDDKAVNPENSIRYYQALKKNNVPAELHLYQNGGHGFGSENKATDDDWMQRLKHWMEHNQFLQKTK